MLGRQVIDDVHNVHDCPQCTGLMTDKRDVEAHARLLTRPHQERLMRAVESQGYWGYGEGGGLRLLGQGHRWVELYLRLREEDGAKEHEQDVVY